MAGILFRRTPLRLIALLGVLGMACSSSGFLPALVTLANTLDPDHRIFVDFCDGQLELRFHHTDETTAGETNGGEATLATNGLDSHGDHVMQFSSPYHLVLQVSHGSSCNKGFGCVVAMEAGHANRIIRSFSVVSHARPPPGNVVWSRSLRSVVLLV